MRDLTKCLLIVVVNVAFALALIFVQGPFRLAADCASGGELALHTPAEPSASGGELALHTPAKPIECSATITNVSLQWTGARALGQQRFASPALTVRSDFSACTTKDVYLRAQFYQRNVEIRSQQELYCRLHSSVIENELRICKPTSGKGLTAWTVAYVNLNDWPQPPQHGPFKSSSGLWGSAILSSVGCQLDKSALDTTQGKTCFPAERFKDFRTSVSVFPTRGANKTQTYHAFYRSMKGAMKAKMGWTQYDEIFDLFALAASTLPQPFTMVESGEYCGSVTLVLAALRKWGCPNCTFVSADTDTNRRSSCPAGRDFVLESMKKYGVFDIDKTSLYNGLSQDLPLLPAPIGFIFFDDGKIRMANGPQIAVFERKIMVGAIISFHDCWDPKKDEPGVAVNHRGHVSILSELLLTGRYELIHLPKKTDRYGVCAIRKIRGGVHPPKPSAQLEPHLFEGSLLVSLVDDDDNVLDRRWI